MKNFTWLQKMQVCGYCTKYLGGFYFMGNETDFCKSVGAPIKEIGSCPAWKNFWKDDESKGLETDCKEKNNPESHEYENG